MKNALKVIGVVAVGVMGLLTQGCSNNPTEVIKDIPVIVSYANYPVPVAYGDTIQIYQKNQDGSEEYQSTITRDQIDTVMVAKGTTLKAYYTYTRFDRMTEVKDTVNVYVNPECSYKRIDVRKVPTNTIFYVKEVITVEESYRWLISNIEPD